MSALSASLLAMLRDAPWLTAARARAYARILAGLVVVLGAVWIATSHGGMDATGKPLGTDFLSFWSASALTLRGIPAAAYDVAAHAAIQRDTFDGADTGYYAFFYPPLFLLICWPLALLPYGAALTVWLVATGAAYWRVVATFMGRQASALPILAFPAVFTTVGHGQNAFLSTALFGGALLALKPRPVLAGMLFGALAYKPQLGLMIPLFLLATGAWRTVAAGVATVLALSLVATLAFGQGIWAAFLAGAPLARASLEQNLVGAEKLQSVFAAVQLWHGPNPLAYAMQGWTALAAATALVLFVRRRPGSEAAGPALVAASLLGSPFLLDYDLTLLAIPLAWLFAEGQRRGFLPWEKSILLAGFVLPLISRMVAAAVLVPLGPPVIAALLFAVVRRGLAHGAMRRADEPGAPSVEATATSTPAILEPA